MILQWKHIKIGEIPNPGKIPNCEFHLPRPKLIPIVVDIYCFDLEPFISVLIGSVVSGKDPVYSWYVHISINNDVLGEKGFSQDFECSTSSESPVLE